LTNDRKTATQTGRTAVCLEPRAYNRIYQRVIVQGF